MIWRYLYKAWHILIFLMDPNGKKENIQHTLRNISCSTVHRLTAENSWRVPSLAHHAASSTKDGNPRVPDTAACYFCPIQCLQNQVNVLKYVFNIKLHWCTVVFFPQTGRYFPKLLKIPPSSAPPILRWWWGASHFQGRPRTTRCRRKQVMCLVRKWRYRFMGNDQKIPKDCTIMYNLKILPKSWELSMSVLGFGPLSSHSFFSGFQAFSEVPSIAKSTESQKNSSWRPSGGRYQPTWSSCPHASLMVKWCQVACFLTISTSLFQKCLWTCADMLIDHIQ